MLTMMKARDSQPPAVDFWLEAYAKAAFAQPTPADLQTLPGVLATFQPITLAQMTGVALLDRSELKYVLPQSLLLPVLAELRDAYRVLVVAGQPFSRYRTLYFDTDDLELYRRHHAGYRIATRCEHGSMWIRTRRFWR